MPILLTSEKDFKVIKSLPFCYLCGQALTSRLERDKDHVPPSGIFAQADRGQPLILLTHRLCNGSRSKEDQTIGQLVGVLHGRRVNQKHNKLKIKVGRFMDGSRGAALEGFDLKEAIRRWVRGFHAALYGEYLSPDCSFATYPPLPEAIRQGDEVIFAPVPEILPKFVEELRRNRAVGSLDRIVSRNGKCRYECVWAQADNGEWICIYCLDLYNWSNLGDPAHFPRRGCVGSYRREQGGVPSRACTATRLKFEIDNVMSLIPF
jgi:hypothetical protein